LLFFRFLLTKYVEGKEQEWRESDLLLLVLLFDSLTQVKDPIFRRKWFYSFSGINPLIQTISDLPFQEGKRLGLLKVDRSSLFKLLLNSHAFFGLVGKKELELSEIAYARFHLNRSKRIEKRYIGVGYKDKGTLKNKASDGSPGWTEVAVDERFRRQASKIEYSLTNPPAFFPQEIVP
jgi:hypothetical protein